MRTYYGLAIEPDNTARRIYAQITGQMDTGEYIYTEVEQDEAGAVTGKLLLDNQYIRTLKHGSQIFFRV